MRQAHPKGFTLLEITVVLVLLAVAAAVVAPVFRRDSRPNDNLQTVVAGARELAVRRAEALVLQVDERGGWRLTPVGDTNTVSSGSVTATSHALRIRVTPLGACFTEGSGAAGRDAIACTASESRTR